MTTPRIEEMVERLIQEADEMFLSDKEYTREDILNHILTKAHQAGRDEERERLAGLIKPRAQKFIKKVNTGLARSNETYIDMHYIIGLLDDTIKALQDKK